jgi:hypothetical protein
MKNKMKRDKTKNFLLLFIVFTFILSCFPFHPVHSDDIVSSEGDSYKNFWKKDVFPFMGKIWQWIKDNTWLKIRGWFMPEFEKRKQYLEEGLEKEKEEVKEEIKIEAPKVGKSLWERFKELIR